MMTRDRMSIRDILHSCHELTAFCTQNGWIDNASLRYEVEQQDARGVTVAVYFDEVVMEGAGCIAARVPCFGKVLLRLDEHGEVVCVEPR
jgi:hypothetical protein